MTTPTPTVSGNVARDRARVLVMDDDPSFRNLLMAVLRRNYIVAVACDGLAGFNKAMEHPPDIAIIDIQMPILDGLQTLAAIRKEPTLAHVGTIMLTADASRETVLAAVQAGANDYVIKTAFSRDDLERKISKLLSRNATLRQSVSSKPSFGPSSELRGSPLTPSANLSTIPVPHHSAMAEKAIARVTAKASELHSEPEPGAATVTPLPTAPESASELQEILDSWD